MTVKEIWKHEIASMDHYAGPTTLSLRRGAEVLHVSTQDNSVCLWERHDRDAAHVERRTFDIVGTGHPVDDEHWTYIGTVHFPLSRLMWHVHELTAP